jgi:hypothetical protein
MSDVLVGAFTGWCLCLAIILTCWGIVKKRAERVQAIGQRLHDLGRAVVLRHRGAQTGGSSEEWAILARLIEDLDAVVTMWEVAVHDGDE